MFFEPDALLYDDPEHSDDEDRFLLIGPSASLRLLLVVHCCRDKEEVIRLISAREATKRERQAFVADRSA